MLDGVNELVAKARVSRDAMAQLCLAFREDVARIVRYEDRRRFARHEDLVQQGMLGLMRAVHTFRPEKGVAFKTYMYYHVISQVRPYMRMEMLKGNGTGKSPNRKRGQSLRKLFDQAGGDDKEYLRLARAKYKRISEKALLDAVHLPVHVSDTMLWCVPSDSPGADEVVDEHQREATRRKALREAMAELPERHRAAFTACVLEGKTLTEVGADLGVSAERVRQIRDAAYRNVQSRVVKQLRAA